MECNRDEAIRAKTIAEGKLAEKDFAGAKKFALKAQTLYPGLDGLPQMFTTLDVYIAAENKISGEVDWYGILGVNPSADDETIKKQYRKLALVLHPDKNKCVGADGAFKLLSEAWSLLSDKAKRLQYNQRRSSKGLNLKIPTQNVRPSAPPNGYHKFTSRAPSKPVTQKNTAPPPTPPPSFRRTDTFWTICHQCKMHYEYLKIYLNSTLLCPNCHKAFLASEMAPPTNLSKPSNPSHQRHQTKTNHVPGSNSFDPGRNAAANQKPQQGGSAGANSSKQANTQWGPFSRMHGSGSKETIAAKAANVIQQASEKLKREREESQAAAGPGKKRRGLDDDGHVYGGRVPYQMAAGNGGVSTGSVSGLQKPGFETDRGYGSSGLNSKPNSTRELTQLELRNMLMKKAQIEIRQKLNEWSTLAESKRAVTEKVKAKESKGEKGKNTTGHDGNGESSATKRADQADNTSPSTNETDKKEHEPVSMNVPDPDFHDFDLDRTEASFQDNQVWAAYDNDDGMPRFYAIIHKVMTRKPFKMRISWLNSKATSEFSPLEWVSSGFYKTCGEFNVGKHEINKSLNSFSHPVKWTKAPRGRVHICPKMGDVWALYRNWSPDWNAFTPDDKIHKYDMVTVLDDYTEEKGVTVTPLVKVAGFKTVFHPHLDPKKVKRIPNEEMFRFSHQVPSYLLTGEEARNAPKGCLELDPAATPLELLQVITEANEVPVEEKEGKVEEKKGQNRPTIEEEEMGENGKEPAAKAEAADC